MVHICGDPNSACDGECMDKASNPYSERYWCCKAPFGKHEPTCVNYSRGAGAEFTKPKFNGAKPRFSRATLRNWLTECIERREREHGFSRRSGWKQAEGYGEAVNRAYGEYDMLLTIMDEWGN